jgi:hypothetical protein
MTADLKDLITASFRNKAPRISPGISLAAFGAMHATFLLYEQVKDTIERDDYALDQHELVQSRCLRDVENTILYNSATTDRNHIPQAVRQALARQRLPF